MANTVRVYGPDIDLSIRGEKLKYLGDGYAIAGPDADEVCMAFGLSRTPPPAPPKDDAAEKKAAEAAKAKAEEEAAAKAKAEAEAAEKAKAAPAPRVLTDDVSDVSAGEQTPAVEPKPHGKGKGR